MNRRSPAPKPGGERFGVIHEPGRPLKQIAGNAGSSDQSNVTDSRNHNWMANPAKNSSLKSPFIKGGYRGI